MALRRVRLGGPAPRMPRASYSPTGIILALLVAIVLAIVLTRLF